MKKKNENVNNTYGMHVVQPLEVESPQASERYKKMLQNSITNSLTSTNSKKARVNERTNKGTIIHNNIFIYIDNSNTINKLDAKTHKVLDILTEKLTTHLPHKKNPLNKKGEITETSINKSRKVSLTVEEYMLCTGIKDKKEARKQLNEAILTLYNVSLQWYEKNGKIQESENDPETTFHKTRIIDDIGITNKRGNPIKNSRVEVTFSYTLAEHLTQAPIMLYPSNLFKINTRLNPHSYYFGKKTALHYNMNVGRANENIISVKTLLESSPEMPTYDEVMSGNKNIYNRIIKPFERDLDALIDAEVLKSWSYCNSKHQPLTKEQKLPFDYNTFESLFIEFTLLDYPDQTNRLIKKAIQIEKAKEKKAARKNKD